MPKTRDHNTNPYAPYASPPVLNSGPHKAHGRMGQYYLLLSFIALLVATIQGFAQLRWHPISSQLLSLFKGYLVMTSILLPALFFEIFCRRAKRFRNSILSLLGSTLRVLLLFGGLLFFSVNFAFFCMTGRFATLHSGYDRTNIPAYASASGVLLATLLLIAYDAAVSLNRNRTTTAVTDEVLEGLQPKE